MNCFALFNFLFIQYDLLSNLRTNYKKKENNLLFIQLSKQVFLNTHINELHCVFLTG